MTMGLIFTAFWQSLLTIGLSLGLMAFLGMFAIRVCRPIDGAGRQVGLMLVQAFPMACLIWLLYDIVTKTFS